MHMRRVLRSSGAGGLAVLAVLTMAGCRTSPAVAAYVGEEQVSVAELEAAVDERLADGAIAAFAEGRKDELTRRVLSLLVQGEIHDAAAERYGVEVSDGAVRERIRQLLGDDDEAGVYEQLAGQGISRADVFENVRQQLVRREIAVEEGVAEGLGEEALRARYEETRDSRARTRLGYITVPDQRTADAVLADLTRDPASYPRLAARFPGDYTLPEMEERGAEEIPGPLAEGVAAAQPDTGFAVPIEETGGIVVTFVGEVVDPPFEEVRADLENEAAAAADEQVRPLVDEVRDDLDVTVNPRYGVLEEEQIQPSEGGGLVDILGDEPAAGGQGSVPGN